jgi:hypothetical protein
MLFIKFNANATKRIDVMTRNDVTSIVTYIPLTLDPRRDSRVSQTFLREAHVSPKRRADVTGGKPIAVRLQTISGGSTVNPLFASYDIHGRDR